MKDKKRKGTGKTCTNSHTHNHFIRLENTCLFVFSIAALMILCGELIHINNMTMIGSVMMVTLLPFTALFKEDNEDEI